jgi:hypothetical protein
MRAGPFPAEAPRGIGKRGRTRTCGDRNQNPAPWSVFQRSGDRFASRKRVKSKIQSQLGDAPVNWSCQREFNPRSPALKAPYPWHQAMAVWCGRPGSNRTPPVWKTGTQPTTPRPQEWNSRDGRGRRRCRVRPALSVLRDPIDREGITDRVCMMAESTGIEPVRPEGLDALAPRCLTARPTLQFKWRARLDSNQHRAV